MVASMPGAREHLSPARIHVARQHAGVVAGIPGDDGIVGERSTEIRAPAGRESVSARGIRGTFQQRVPSCLRVCAFRGTERSAVRLGALRVSA
jgi:hypothetical protein